MRRVERPILGRSCRTQVFAAPTTTESRGAGDDKSVDAEIATETLAICGLLQGQFASQQRLFPEIGFR